MNRLENQIETMQNELNLYKAFAAEKTALLEKDLTEKLFPILKASRLMKYYISADNNLIDKSPFDGKLMFRVYISVNLSGLSDRAKKNLEAKLRKAGIPMPICPITNNTINLVYCQK